MLAGLESIWPVHICSFHATINGRDHLTIHTKHQQNTTDPETRDKKTQIIKGK